MTSAQLISRLRFLVGDKNSVIWTSDTDLYDALTEAQNEFLLKVLGAPTIEDNYDLLAELIVTEAKSIDVAGLSLSTLDIVRGGIVSIKASLRGEDRYFTKIPASKIGLMQNQYFGGDDYNPKFIVLGNVLYVYVSIGSYPVTAILSYVSTPVNVSGSVTLAVNPSFHDVVAVMAESILRRTNDDMEAAMVIDSLVQRHVADVVRTGQKEPATNTIGQYMRKREEGKP